MKKLLSLSALVFFALVFLSLATPATQAGRPFPPNDRARGLVYDGLGVADSGECKGGFKVRVNGPAGTVEHCTHGPDAAPADFAFAKSATPVAAATLSTGSVMCDGDGVTGKRVQVLYVRSSDVPSRYTTYLASFKQWAADADAMYMNSAAQTGGSRRIRFVTDANCNPVVTEVVLSAGGDDSFGNTIGELNALGYNRRDRKYMIFMDAHVYCGIGSVVNDDSASKTNKSNNGPHYGRVDNGCWSGQLAAHELMHNLGGVQINAPHTDNNFHCNDGNDLMCNYSGHAIQTVCANSTDIYTFDCNKDDYFSTAPAANSYLATHWNAANNLFLIAPTTSTKTR